MRSPQLRSGLRVLDAGCGTGAVLLALHDAVVARRLTPVTLHGFDLTPAMLDQLRASLRVRGIKGVELVQADVLALDALPPSWRNFHLIASASMLEYVPHDHFVTALIGLRALLAHTRAMGKEYDALIALGQATLPLVIEKLADPAGFLAVQLYDALQPNEKLLVQFEPDEEGILEGEQGRAPRRAGVIQEPVATQLRVIRLIHAPLIFGSRRTKRKTMVTTRGPRRPGAFALR